MKSLPVGTRFSKFIWLLMLIAIWEITAKSGLLSPQLFPDIETILASLVKETANGSLLTGTLKSIIIVLAGIFLGVILSFLLSIPAHYFIQARNLLDILTSILHPLPGMALFPILIMFFGIGTAPLLFIIIHSVLWPLCINIRSGFENIPPVYMKIGRNYELPPVRFFFRIILPAAFPQILAGLRIAWARAWRAIISAEMLFGITSGKGGLGWYIFNKRIFMDTPGMYAGLLVLVFIGLLVETVLFRRVENSTTGRWSTDNE